MTIKIKLLNVMETPGLEPGSYFLQVVIIIKVKVGYNPYVA